MALNLRIESSGHNAIVYMISQFYLLASASFADIECKLMSHCCLHLFALGCICSNVNSVSCRPIINPPPPACCWLSSFDRLIPAQSPPAPSGGRLSPLSDKICDGCIENLVAVTVNNFEGVMGILVGVVGLLGVLTSSTAQVIFISCSCIIWHLTGERTHKLGLYQCQA